MDASLNSRPAWILIGLMTLTLLACTAGTALVFRLDRQAAVYPNSSVITSNSKYRLPSSFRWDDAYSTTDDFRDVFTWYSITFDLGPETAANGGCAMTEEIATLLFVFDRYTGVMICEMGDERLIYVNRTTYLR
ncbi:MAG: hypothetical protein QNJ45_00825 [Ardenticatenaceae bacterium]|nr:hypothetical protein [Ardenticatenaceae bacterium]